MKNQDRLVKTKIEGTEFFVAVLNGHENIEDELYSDIRIINQIKEELKKTFSYIFFLFFSHHLAH
jgi:hypothetical protein